MQTNKLYHKVYCYTLRKNSKYTQNPQPTTDSFPELRMLDLAASAHHPLLPFNIRTISLYRQRLLVVLDWIQLQKHPRVVIQLYTKEKKYEHHFCCCPRYVYGLSTHFQWIYLDLFLQDLFPGCNFALAYHIKLYLTQPGMTFLLLSKVVSEAAQQ